MAVTFFDPGAGNYFAHKHLYIVDNPLSVSQLIDEGVKVLDERRTAANQRKRGKRNGLVPIYGGSTKPEENSIIVMAQGGFMALEVAATQAASGLRPGQTQLFWFKISNAALVEATINGGARASSTGYVELRAGVDGNGIYVDHFNDTCDMRWLPVRRNATDELRSMAFRTTEGELQQAINRLGKKAFHTTASELQQAITRLRHVPPPGVRLPPAIVYGVPGLDLGFLDE